MTMPTRRILVATDDSDGAGREIGDVVEVHAAEILSRAKEKARRVGISNIQTRFGLGGTAVVGKRGRGQLSGLLIGSVSQKLVSLASCSVLVVP